MGRVQGDRSLRVVDDYRFRGADSLSDWMVLSGVFTRSDLPALVPRGFFVIEFVLPLTGPVLLFDFCATDGWDRALSLFYEPEVGLSFLHRQGCDLVNHLLPGSLPTVPGIGRICLSFDAPARQWEMRFTMAGDLKMPARISRGQAPLPMRPADVRVLSKEQICHRRHPAVLWFGLSDGKNLPANTAWIGLQTPVETERGPVAAGRLALGDLIDTSDGLLPLIEMKTVELPARGTFAPIHLRAPFFAERWDLLASPDQMIAISDPVVEDLFGEYEVLVPVSALVDGYTAMTDQRRGVSRGVALYFDRPTMILADGCQFLAALPEDKPPLTCLKPCEVKMLTTLLGRDCQRWHA